MENIIALVETHKLLELKQGGLNRIKKSDELCFIKDNDGIYKNSLYRDDEILYFLGFTRAAGEKKRRKTLFLVSTGGIDGEFIGHVHKIRGFYIMGADLSFENSLALKKKFPFTAPVSLRKKKTTIGCGDRLGYSTPGHLLAAKQYDVYPVLAQQSIRELNFTGRTYKNVTADTAFLVFQAGYEKGYGADGDHLKTLADIDIALEAGMPMITLDLSEVMNADAAGWSDKHSGEEFDKLPARERNRLLEAYGDKIFKAGEMDIHISLPELKRCAAMYKKALDFAAEVNSHLRERRGEEYDLEISIDETSAPTLPEHHLFIIKELLHRQITVNSLAPRFTGDFQKGIDYIGDKTEFEKQFAIHCRIAKDNGDYKISVHSGSDKFSVYPVIGKYTGLRLHLKTAGTSWLEAVRCIAVHNPSLYRTMHKMAFEYYGEATKFYHITADISKIEDIDNVGDADLSKYLDRDESRQLIHITYGGLLNDPCIREDFFNTLDEFEQQHYDLVKKHFEKHIGLLGVKRLAL